MNKYISVIFLSCLMSAAVVAEPLPSGTAPQTGVQDVADAQTRETPVLGEAVERQLPIDGQFTTWAQDGGAKSAQGDHVETRQVLEKQVKTIKLHNVVPPVLFSSGEANIPDEYIERVRKILDGMKDRKNVRLHLVGHTENVKLTGAAKAKDGNKA